MLIVKEFLTLLINAVFSDSFNIAIFYLLPLCIVILNLHNPNVSGFVFRMNTFLPVQIVELSLCSQTAFV